jgi:hypothetical protein
VLIRATCVICGLLGAAAARADDAPSFSRDILPILSDNCFKCHGPDEAQRESELRLDDEASAKRIQDDIAVIRPGDSAGSELVRRITADESERMPPVDSNLSLTQAEIDLIRRWIDAGAQWGGHWAYERPTRPVVPVVEGAAQTANPIDAFIAARLEQEGLERSPAASRETLIRRVTLDLTGLPPTLAEVDAWLADSSPRAYEQLVERVLASPAYGERMAWDWLNAARYADSNGYQGDGERTMWPWRDWVVDAFNRNLPYDEFTRWQLAGDLLPEATFEQKLATGFCRNHMINGEGGRIPEENRVYYVMDMAETTGTVWLGLTFNCCRCHDHKFDPLLRRDYYSLVAFFNQTPVDGGGGNPQTPPVLEVPSAEQAARRDELAAAIPQARSELDAYELTFFPRDEAQTPDQSESAAGAPDNIREILKKPAADRNRDELRTLEQHFEPQSAEYAAGLRAVREQLEARDALDGAIPRVMVMADRSEYRQTFMLDKGLYNKPQDEVFSAFPEFLKGAVASGSPLNGDSNDDAPVTTHLNRLDLANWLVSPEHPLTARITVNRLWQQFFGVGLVKTPEDFGVQGEKPVHPELLDWLAVEFVESGWDVKQMVRLIVTSRTYRQTSRATAELIERDPDNRLLARGPRYRMPSWMLRDQALAVSGLLVPTIGGAPVKPYQPEGVWEEATFGNKQYQQDHGAALYRRSLYTFWRRIIGPTMFFDSAARQVCTVKVARTNTPLHALSTLHDVQYVEAARVLAERTLHEPLDRDAARVEWAFRTMLARTPGEAEQTLLVSTLERLREEFGADPAAAAALLAVGESPRDASLDPIEHAAWTALCNALFNLDEALVRE